MDVRLIPPKIDDPTKFVGQVEAIKEYLTDRTAVGDLLGSMLLRIERLEAQVYEPGSEPSDVG